MAPSEPSVTVFSPQMDELAVAQVMGVENERSRYSQEIKTLIKWAKKEGAENPDQLKWSLRSLMAKLGTPPLSERWIVRASRYAYLQLQEDEIRAEQDSLMR